MPQSLIGAILDANRTRKDFVADEAVQMVMDLVYAGVRRPVFVNRCIPKGTAVVNLDQDPTLQAIVPLVVACLIRFH